MTYLAALAGLIVGLIVGAYAGYITGIAQEQQQ